MLLRKPAILFPKITKHIGIAALINEKLPYLIANLITQAGANVTRKMNYLEYTDIFCEIYSTGS